MTPTRTGLLDVGDGQSMYWEETGAADGVPALYLHGGPGGGLGRGGYVQRFDLDRCRVIGVDQRGCGRSVPLATDPAHDLEANTTARLVADLELLREHLGIDAWLLNGVSWGSTLALAYALAHPDRVRGVVLMAVTTTGRREVDWITETVGALYPEEWGRLAAVAEDAGIGYRRGAGRLVGAYAALLRSPDPAVRDRAARAWTRWEGAHIAIGSGPSDGAYDPVRDAVLATLVTHYWAADGFLDPPVLDRAGELAGIPGVLIHGRRDVSGPVVTAWQLHRAWPGSELVVVETEGHGGPEMVAAWSAANGRLVAQLESPTDRRA